MSDLHVVMWIAVSVLGALVLWRVMSGMLRDFHVWYSYGDIVVYRQRVNGRMRYIEFDVVPQEGVGSVLMFPSVAVTGAILPAWFVRDADLIFKRITNAIPGIMVEEQSPDIYRDARIVLMIMRFADQYGVSLEQFVRRADRAYADRLLAIVRACMRGDSEDVLRAMEDTYPASFGDWRSALPWIEARLAKKVGE